ncbi:MAG: hypothetical protein IJW59_05615 [Clostridia bacterium]|nr:hypothetical protein [Clostridia bacterium]
MGVIDYTNFQPNYNDLRKYYRGYGVYNRQGKLVKISSMSDKELRSFQKDLANERKNFLSGKKGWKVIIRKIK